MFVKQCNSLTVSAIFAWAFIKTNESNEVVTETTEQKQSIRMRKALV